MDKFLEQATKDFENHLTQSAEGQSAPDLSPSSSEPQENLQAEGEGKQSNGADSQAEQPSIQDLSKLERFLFNGKEWTPKDLKDSVLRYEDYTRKTQEIAQERKYNAALVTDLAKVRNGEATVEQFKQVYPEKFHRFLEFLSNSSTQAQPQANQQQNPEQLFQKLFQEKFGPMQSKLEAFEQEKYQAKVQAHRATIDSTFERLAPKYPFADNVTVLTKAQVKLEQERERMREEGRSAKEIEEAEILTPDEWEKLFKTEHERIQRLSSEAQSKQFNEQKQANKRAKDTAQGGGTPGEAPKKMSMKEAEQAYLKQMTSGR